jgi:large subunit ribosomal protein L10e
VFQIHVSRKWGFTKWSLEDYEPMRQKGTLVPDGTNVQYKPDKGPLAAWKKAQQA